MTTAALAVRQLKHEQRVFRRTPATLIFTLAFPLLLLVIFGTLNKNERLSMFGGVRFTQYYVPSMAAFGLMSACFSSVGGGMVYRREGGQLKRLRATPLPLSALLGGFIGNAVLMGLLVTAVNIAVGVALYGVELPDRWAAFALVILVGSASFCAMGVAFSTFVPSLEATDPMIFGVFMPIVFISGTFFPIPPDSVLSQIAGVFPVRHLIGAAFGVFDPRQGGTGIRWADLAVVATWGLAGALLAARRFRWEPARR